jgi:rsbT co-antagonist protein RsbR
MTPSDKSNLATVLDRDQAELLDTWTVQQRSSLRSRPDLIGDADLREQSREFLGLVADALRRGGGEDIRQSAWQPVRQFLASISTSRSMQGFTPGETATFVMSLKQPLFERLQEVTKDPGGLGDDLWRITSIVDGLALHSVEVFMQERERVIARQNEDMLELSTPVVKLWDGILALPMIGTLDSARTQVVMETLLQRILETGAEVAIIDITGVPTVDTLVAQHLIKTVTAARLMGADCIISGVRPQIAATIVHLGVDLSDVMTKATLADAFRTALRRTGQAGGRGPAAGPAAGQA